MSNIDERTAEACARLAAILPERAPSLWQTLRPPVSDQDLKALKAAIYPYILPAAVETWLKFADGQHPDNWWPSMYTGPLLTAKEMAEFYTAVLEFHPPGLLPICYESHFQVSIELVESRTPVLIDTTVSSVDWKVVAPSFSAMLDAATDLAECGLLDSPYPPASSDISAYQSQMSFLDQHISLFYLDYDWSTSPFPQQQWFERGHCPTEWGPVPEL